MELFYKRLKIRVEQWKKLVKKMRGTEGVFVWLLGSSFTSIVFKVGKCLVYIIVYKILYIMAYSVGGF